MNKPLDFIRRYTRYSVTDKELEEIIKRHIEYGTCLIIYDDNNDVCAFARWNIEGDVAHILDVVMKENHRREHLLARMLAKGIKMFPYVKYLKWEREKYPKRGTRIYKLEETNGKTRNSSTITAPSTFNSRGDAGMEREFTTDL